MKLAKITHSLSMGDDSLRMVKSSAQRLSEGRSDRLGKSLGGVTVVPDEPKLVVVER